MEALAELEGMSAANVMTKSMIPLLKSAYSASDLVARFSSGISRQVTMGLKLAPSIYARTDAVIVLSTKLIVKMCVVRLKSTVKSKLFSI